MADKETIIGAETRISGEVRGDENLVVRGRIDGKVQITEALTVDAGGIVQADVEAREVVVLGVLVGNITAVESVRLGDKARMVGDISAPRVVMEAGAAYRGRVEMGDVDVERITPPKKSSEAPSARPAPPRLSPPSRATSAPVSAAPRVVSAPPRPMVPPSLPRPDAATVASASAPAWAKKKLKRR